MLVNFDFDGVLVDSLAQLHGISVAAANRVGAARGPTLEHFQTIRNLTFHDLGRAIGLSTRTAEIFANDMFEQLRTTADSPRMFHGIAEVLRELAGRHKIVVITANVRSSVERVLRGSKADKLGQAIKIYRSLPAETFMIGDSIGDISQGRQAGVRTIAVTWGFQQEGLLQDALPDYIVRSPQELLSILL
jgi:phosphoglycolate phosphatase